MQTYVAGNAESVRRSAQSAMLSASTRASSGRGGRRGSSRRKSGAPAGQHRADRCHQCGQPGQWKAECPARDEVCYNSKQPGHISRDCPEPPTEDTKQVRLRRSSTPQPSLLTFRARRNSASRSSAGSRTPSRSSGGSRTLSEGSGGPRTPATDRLESQRESLKQGRLRSEAFNRVNPGG